MDLSTGYLSITVAISTFLILGSMIWKQASFQSKIQAFIEESIRDDKEMKDNIEECYKEIADVSMSYQKDIRALELSSVRTDGKIDTLIEKVTNMITEFREFKKECQDERDT